MLRIILNRKNINNVINRLILFLAVAQ